MPLLSGPTHGGYAPAFTIDYQTQALHGVRAIFYWAHVLGLRADVIVEPCRHHAQAVVATLQLLLIATRGHRSYTSTELDIIFRDVGRQFFRHLEALAKHVHDVTFASHQRRHNNHPEEVPAPVSFQPKDRYCNYNNTSLLLC